MSFPNWRPMPMLAAVLLAGCATISNDRGMNDVAALTKERTGQSVQRQNADTASANEQTISQLLERSLTADTAVQIALLNNQDLQASFAELGISEAQAVQAGKMRNPGFSFSRLSGGGNTEIDRGVMFDLIGLLTLPMRSGIEQGRFEQAKLQTASVAVQLASDTRKAYFNAVAAQQNASFAEQVLTAAQAGAELVQQMAKTGNWSKLDQAREQVFYAEAVAQSARARQTVVTSREQLTRLLGLRDTQTAFKLPERLPDLPAEPNAVSDSESLAMSQRLDVQMAKRDTDATANALGLTKATGFINVFDAGYINKSQTGQPRENGYEISLELPIFDWGGARVHERKRPTCKRYIAPPSVAVRARSEVREAYSAYRIAYDIAKHYRDEVVPLRKRISDEVLLRYNGMLPAYLTAGRFARTDASVNAAIEAQRDFWIADSLCNCRPQSTAAVAG
jgi:outer membrane protein TolC